MFNSTRINLRWKECQAIRNFSSRSQTIFLGQRVWPIFENSFESLFDRMPRIAWNCCNRVTPVKVGTNDPERRNLSRDWWTKFESLSKLENKIESLKIWKVKSYRYRYPLDWDERNEKLRKHVCWIKKVKVFSSCSAVK